MSDDGAEREGRRGTRGPAGPGRPAGRAGRPFMEGWMVALASLVAVALGVSAWLLVRPSAGTASARRSGRTMGWIARALPAKPSKETSPTPTEVFGHMRKYGVPMYLPARSGEMIAVGFHQAWNTRAVDIIPDLKVHPKDKYESTKQALAGDVKLRLFLMVSRGRGSSEYSAADCAMARNATVLAPVDGVVTLVKRYKLEGRYDDVHIEIEPDGAAPERVVMIHLKDAKVKEGQRVIGGVTAIAVVRHLPIDSQVNRYLPQGQAADHTHIQINAVGYKLNEGS